MRFVENGPSLPDDLLTARDTGRVLFFCGAGVSYAQAGLPNFADLAERVLSHLGSANDSPARHLFGIARDQEQRSGVTGLVATDRIFGLLEREFEPRDVREAVANALRPVDTSKIGAHKILLDLSRTRAGMTRLITTNFDRLFEDCDPSLASSNPPHLPDPRRARDFHGVIHLHGRVDAEYKQACDDELVLSSADFGRAYLSEGWATKYIQALLTRFQIVFVGYSADDPPVQYLLEALSRSEDIRNDLYAFQAGDTAQASAQWAHKGVQPIVYDSADRHAALWKTLEAWAERARDIDGWHRKIIAMGSKGPEALQPFQRGMVAHLAATEHGATFIADEAHSLPAEWLAVFDPKLRYGQPGHTDIYHQTGWFDPFDAYHIDTDEPPMPVNPGNPYNRRQAPQASWDAFAITTSDRRSLSAGHMADIRGDTPSPTIELTRRLEKLGTYLLKVSPQPAALWWAAHQKYLHPGLQRLIERGLDTSEYIGAVRDGWRILFRAWRTKERTSYLSGHHARLRAKSGGWCSTFVYDLLASFEPGINVHPVGPCPPSVAPDVELHKILQIHVHYEQMNGRIEIPDHYDLLCVKILEYYVEYAIILEAELHPRSSMRFDSLRDAAGKDDEAHFGINILLNLLIKFTKRLLISDREAALQKISGWRQKNNDIFTWLYVWAMGEPELLKPRQIGEALRSLSDDHFWAPPPQARDLLFALHVQWPTLPRAERTAIEKRLLTGGPSWVLQGESEVIGHHSRLSRLQWLHEQGIEFSFDFAAERKRLQHLAPDWQPSEAAHIVRDGIVRSYPVNTDTDATNLTLIPLRDIVKTATQLTTFDPVGGTRYQPFDGFVDTKPARALAALARSGFDVQAWTTFLTAEGDKQGTCRMLTITGHRLAQLSSDQIGALNFPISQWLCTHLDTLLDRLPAVFNIVWTAWINTHRLPSPTEICRSSDSDSIEDAFNSAIGRLVNKILGKLIPELLNLNENLPEVWKERFSCLLNLPEPHCRHIIAVLTTWLRAIYRVDSLWTEKHILVFFDSPGDNSDILWDGYFSGSSYVDRELNKRLKHPLINLASTPKPMRHHANLSALLLEMWANINVLDDAYVISNEDLREILIHSDDNLRKSIIFHLTRRSTDTTSSADWQKRIIPFLQNVWPRQAAIRTPLMSMHLTNLALAIPAMCPDIVEIILPWLRPFEMGIFYNRESPPSAENASDSYARAVLALLEATLPKNLMYWPHDIEEALHLLERHPATLTDPRLTEIRRRKNAS